MGFPLVIECFPRERGGRRPGIGKHNPGATRTVDSPAARTVVQRVRLVPGGRADPARAAFSRFGIPCKRTRAGRSVGRWGLLSWGAPPEKSPCRATPPVSSESRWGGFPLITNCTSPALQQLPSRVQSLEQHEMNQYSEGGQFPPKTFDTTFSELSLR